MENVTSKTTLEHCHKQFVSFHKSHKFSDQYELQMALLKTVAKTGPQADPVFREECKPTTSLPAVSVSFVSSYHSLFNINGW